MIHYLLLVVFTIIIAFLAFKIWKKTHEVAFILGLGLMYYWSLLGPWFIVYDELTGQKGKNFGLAYYDYLTRLFPVHADNIYLVVISFYALFIIVIELTLLFFSKKRNAEINSTVTPVNVSHLWLIIVCVSTSLISLFIVWKQILIAAKFNESVYYITRNYHDSYYTVHQLFNQVAVVSLYIGFVSYIGGERSRYITGSKKRIYILAYAFAIFFIEGYLLFLGNKREIFFGGILGVLFYMANVHYKINFKALGVFIIIILIPLFFNDGLRSYSPEPLTEYFDVSHLEFQPKEEVAYTQFSASNTVFRFLFSNEMFVPHFSMYGILSHNLSLTYGSSLVSLAASLVPHFLWPDRPGGVYEYYVSSVHAKEGTGYTIHHASAWYLNFGILGIIAGAFILGWLWVWFYNKLSSIESIKNKFIKILFIIAFSAFTAQIPAMMRTGPEGYKSLVFEAILLPVVMIFLASIVESNISERAKKKMLSKIQATRSKIHN
jgi:hypothetical protein